MPTMKYVTSAPTGAARLNTMRCTLAARLLNPCLSSVDVSPNAAGALWTRMAKKMIRPTFMFDVVADAPIATPSAAAWITSPIVVASDRDCFGEGVKLPRKDSSSRSESGW